MIRDSKCKHDSPVFLAWSIYTLWYRIENVSVLVGKTWRKDETGLCLTLNQAFFFFFDDVSHKVAQVYDRHLYFHYWYLRPRFVLFGPKALFKLYVKVRSYCFDWSVPIMWTYIVFHC